MIKKRAQAWGFDLIIATSIFLIGILIFFLYSLNYNSSDDETLKRMNYEANNLADNLLSEGFPLDWNQSRVIKIGLTSDNVINQTKLESLYHLSIQDYNMTKSLFLTNYEYFFNFSEAIIIDGSNVMGIGRPFVNQSNLIRINRFTVYKNKPVTAYIYLWN